MSYLFFSDSVIFFYLVAFVKFGRDNYTVSENDKEVVLQVVLTGNITSPVTAR